VATGIGFVIGLEREHASAGEKKELFAGVRTFVVVVLLGFLSALLGFVLSPWLFIAGLGGVVALTVTSYRAASKRGETGSTTEFTVLLVFLLGGLTLLGYIEASLAIMVVLLVILSLKVSLRRFIGRITDEEFLAFVRFIVVAMLAFPFLPNRPFGPFDAINPREIGWVIVLTSGIGFAGYMLIKFLGSKRGILFTGMVGGLVSSTVVTWVFSKKSRQSGELSAHCTVAILAASCVMVVRVFVWVVIFNQTLLARLLLPLGLVLTAGLLAGWYFYKKQSERENEAAEIPLGEPLNLRDAVFFGLLYTAILLVVSYANHYFGAKGIFLSTAVAALTDIDAITISMAKLGGSSITALTAQKAILLATLCNTVVKIGIALWFGSILLRRFVLIGFGLILLAGLAGFWLLG
jgi:uncharacterized membrane protein (DUF4010 family)